MISPRCQEVVPRDPRDESSPSGNENAPEDIFVHESELSAAVEGDEKPMMLTAGQRVYYSTKEDKRYGTQADAKTFMHPRLSGCGGEGGSVYSFCSGRVLVEIARR